MWVAELIGVYVVATLNTLITTSEDWQDAADRAQQRIEEGKKNDSDV